MNLTPVLQPYSSYLTVGEVLRWPAVPSEHLNHDRDVLIWLPPGYHEQPTRRYPVLYLQDGQNKFDPATSFAGEDWNVDGVATRLIERGEIEPFIMVAIYNSSERLHEYNPLRPEGQHYGRFLAEELMPAIAQHFRTVGGRGNAVMGSSMGGLISLALLLWYPQHFSGSAALSPSLWVLWREGGAISWLRRFSRLPQPSRVYLDHGTVGYEGRSATLTRSVVDHFRRNGFPEERLDYHQAEGGEHNEVSWRARVDRPLRFLFAGREGWES